MPHDFHQPRNAWALRNLVAAKLNSRYVTNLLHCWAADSHLRKLVPPRAEDFVPEKLLPGLRYVSTYLGRASIVSVFRLCLARTTSI